MKFDIFHRKHIKEIQAIGLILLIVAEMVVFPTPSAQAATYTWTQASWAGGAAATTATHTSNQTGQTNYATGESADMATSTNLSVKASSTITPAVFARQTSSTIYASTTASIVGIVSGSDILISTNSGTDFMLAKAGTAVGGAGMTSINFTNSSVGWAVGSSGKIIKTTDSGTNWTAQTSGTTTALKGVFAADTNNVWAVGNDGGILYTSNGGTTWTGQTSGTSVTLYGVFFANSTTGWAGGDSGTILYTTNSGTTWTPQTVPGGLHVKRIFCISATTCWGAGNTGGFTNVRILTTTDAGTTWTLRDTGLGSFANSQDVFFVDANTGWAGGTSEHPILKSTDGGINWVEQTSGDTNGFGSVACTSSTNCFAGAGGSGYSFLKTTNGGTTWSKHRGWNTLTGTLSAVYFVDDNTGWVGNQAGGLWKTTDRGESWTAQTSNLSGISDIKFINSNIGWAVGSNAIGYGVISYTSNGGTTWTVQLSGDAGNASVPSRAIDCVNSTTCWAVGNSGGLWATTNGGTTWTQQTSGTTANMTDIKCFDANTCYAVTYGSTNNFLKTANGGATWTASTVTNVVASYGISLDCTDSSNCWVWSDAGASARVLKKTTDGGSTWSAVSYGSTLTTGSSAGSTVAVATTSSIIWAIGQESKFARSSDGGTTWAQYDTGYTGVNGQRSSVFGDSVWVAAGSNLIKDTPTYPTSAQTLSSSVFNSEQAGNLTNRISWDETVPSGTSVQFQMRTGNGTATTSYMGPDGTAGTYFSNSGSGCTGTGTIICSISSGIAIGDGANDQYMQYQVTLTAASAGTPTVDNVIVRYVVNLAPNFDTSVFGGNGLAVSQNATTTAPIGQVVIQYAARDGDTTTGSPANQGLVTPSFDYNLNDGVGWQTITSGYLAAGDLDPKTVAEISYNTYSATWNVVSQLGAAIATTTAQIRVTVNDLEGANNTAVATETGVTIDTTPPVISATTFNGTANMISATSTDLFSQSMRVSNNADSSADGVNANSGIWVATSSQVAWTPPANKTIYFAVRDQFGNTATSTIVGVASTTATNIRDVSNPAETNPRLFTSWGVYSDVAGATFSGYKIYRGTSTGAETYLATVSNSAQNYYIDLAVSSTTRYYYKTTVIDTGGDESGYSDEVNGIPNGQGFGTDLVAPIITTVVITNVKATTADVTWTTDELSDSYADYSISPSTAFGTTQSSPSFTTTHTISLTGLTPSTNYLVRARSKDVYDNIGSSNNSGAGYAFTTTGGPIITAVSVIEVTDETATIEWNTDKDSSSLVFYSTNSTLTSATQAGSTSMVGGAGVAGVWQHSVTLTGLTEQTKYYFKVRSLDSSDNIGEDTNSGVYYYFNTTLDTSPPILSSIASVLTTFNASVIGWQTNKKATTRVAYGTSTGSYSAGTPLDALLTTSHYAALQGLTERTTYYYVVASVDANGNAATSTEQTLLTTGSSVATIMQYYSPTCTVAGSSATVAGSSIAADKPDTTAPTISNIKVEPGSSSAKVSLTASEPASVFIQYGEDISSGYQSINGSFDYLVSPAITLPILKMGTTYHYSIKAQDKAGNIFNTPDATFKTQFLSELSDAKQLEDQATFRQKIENIVESALPSLSPPFLTEPRVTSVTSDSAVIEWDTNISASGLVAFAPSEAFLPTAINPYIGELGSAQERVKNHKVELIGLDSATTYHAQAISQGIIGPFGKSVDFTFITKPSVPEVSILEVGPNKISIGWKTNSLTSSFIEYRNIRTGELQTKGTDDLVREHIVTLEELSPNTRYELKVFGRDVKGNKTESVSRIVSTVVDITKPKLINVKINNALVPGRADRLQTIVSWQTDELADSQVFYGAGVVAGEELKNKTPLDSTLTFDHTAVISLLKPGAVYRFKVASVDQVGNRSESPIQVILTPQQAESIIDVISSNLEQSFGWIKLIQRQYKNPPSGGFLILMRTSSLVIARQPTCPPRLAVDAESSPSLRTK